MTFLQHCWTLAAAALAVFSFSAHADYLERSIPLVNHFAPGVGAMDIAARKRAGKMAGRLGIPVVVAASQPDAVGILASSAVACGAGDGYSIDFGTSSGLGFAELLNKDFPHEPVPMRTLRRRADGQGQPAAPDRHCHARTAA